MLAQGLGGSAIRPANANTPRSVPVVSMRTRCRQERPAPCRVHPICKEIRFPKWANLLLEQATLAEGGTLEDPAGFVKRINDLMLALSAGK